MSMQSLSSLLWTPLIEERESTKGRDSVLDRMKEIALHSWSWESLSVKVFMELTERSDSGKLEVV